MSSLKKMVKFGRLAHFIDLMIKAGLSKGVVKTRFFSFFTKKLKT